MSDNKDRVINCPACGKPMKKIFMPEQGINLDVCVDGCGGIYFDNREFSKFDEPNEDISPLLEVLKNKEFIKVNQSVSRFCPACGTEMVKNYSSSNQEVQVDECYNCGGKFLDFGELEKIRSQYNTEKERAADVMRKLYSDVGSEMITPLFVNTYKERKTKRNSFILGLIVAVFWLFYHKGVIESHFGNPMSDSSMFYTVIVVAVGIVILFTGIGSLLGKSNSLLK